MTKEMILVSTAKVQESGSNVFATIPAPVRSILKPKKGDELEFVIYSDKSVEVRIKTKDSENE